MIRILAILLALGGTAQAQSVTQSGSVTPGHAARWVTNGVIGDAGTAANGVLTSIGTTGSGPTICANSGPITGAYNQICLGTTQTGGGTISLNNYNGATGGLSLTVNGVSQGFPVIQLPVTVNDLVCVATTGGNLKDCGTNPTIGGNVTFGGTITAASLSTVGVIAGSLCATSGGLFLYESGTNCFSATATNITVASTGVLNGTSGRILYDNSHVLGELPVTGSAGNVVLSVGPTLTGTVTLPDSSTWTSSGIGSLVALGVGETAPSSGNINISGQYQVAGSQIAASNLSNGTTGTGNVVLASSPSFTSSITLGGITGSTQCLQVNSSGVVSGTSATCGVVSSVSGTSGQITVSPTTGATVVSLPSTITSNETFSGTINFTGTAQLNGTAFGTFATQNYATPPAIGGTTPAAGSFSTLSATTPIALSSGGTNSSTAATARTPTGLNIDELTSKGDTNYQILATDRTVGTSATLTAARTWTLPAASSLNAGQYLIVQDFVGGVSNADTLTIQRAGSDTLNGSATSVTINTSGGGYLFISNGINNWSAQALGAQASSGVSSLNGQTGAVNVVAGAAISVNTAGGNITVANGGITAANALTGSLTFADNGGAKVTSSGTTITFGNPGGYLNKFRNGTMDIAQRGTSVTIGTSGNYSLDGWKVYFTGSTSVAAAQVSALQAGAFSELQITGATSNTDVTIEQRIESYVATPLRGATVTVQFQFRQTTGSSVTPKISTCYASAQDNFGTCTSDLASTSLTSCATATWCTEAYTFTASTSASNGYAVDFDCGAITSGQTCIITAADIRVTPGVATGINSNPPPPELRPIAAELAFCQRYFWSSYGNGVAPGTASTVATAMSTNTVSTATFIPVVTIFYPVQMRAVPNPVTLYNPSTGSTTNPIWDSSNTTSYNGTSQGGSTGNILIITSSGGYSVPNTLNVHATASAEL